MGVQLYVVFVVLAFAVMSLQHLLVSFLIILGMAGAQTIGNLRGSVGGTVENATSAEYLAFSANSSSLDVSIDGQSNAGSTTSSEDSGLVVLSPVISNNMSLSAASYCADSNQYCSAWAQSGQCQHSPSYMMANCQLSCGMCVQPPQLTQPRWADLGVGDCRTASNQIPVRIERSGYVLASCMAECAAVSWCQGIAIDGSMCRRYVKAEGPLPAVPSGWAQHWHARGRITKVDPNIGSHHCYLKY